jgi:glycosyltransferase involved in cell wall biosynthesis
MRREDDPDRMSARRARVVLLAGQLGRGGAEAQLVELALGLDRARYDVSVLLLGTRNEHAERLSAARVPVASLGKCGPWDVLVLRRLQQKLREQRPDVLHATLFHPNLLAAAVARRAGVRALVLSQRGSYEHNLPLPWPAFWRGLARRAARGADVLIVNSEAAAQEEREAGVPAARIVTVRNGVAVPATPVSSRADLGLPADGPLVVSVGRLEPVKGHRFLLEAWPHVLARHPQARLVVLGEGSQREALRAQAEALGVSARVSWLGERPAEPYIAAADLFVQASLSEGMPNAVLEAMALGIAVVATRVGGTPEALEDGASGTLVAAGDADALAAGITRMLDDAGARSRLAQAAGERARKQFSLAAMIAATQAVYERVLGGPRGPRSLLVFGHRPYPNDHAVLETVYTRELPASGWSPVWVLQPASPADAGRRAEWNGTPVYVTRRRHWTGPRRHLELLREYVRAGGEALRTHDIALVQARTGMPEGLAAWWLSRRNGLPFVFHCSFPIPLGRRAALERRGRPGLARVVHAVETRAVDALLRRADLVLAVSDTMAAGMQARGIDRAVAFPLGADTTVSPAAVVAVPAPADTIAYVGSTDAKRNPSFVFEVLRRVREGCPSAHLLLVGEASPELRGEAARMNLTDAITFVGRVPRAEVPRYLRAARCSLAPIPPDPLYVVSSATKVVESLGLGVPVVANGEIPDQRELVERSGGGLVTPYDAEAMAAAVVALLRDPADAARRGEAGRRYVCAHRSYAVLARGLAGRYDALVARPAAEPAR